MTEAASHLEKLAANDVPPANLLDVHYCIVAPGPAVGPGRHGLVRHGQCLAPAPWLKVSPAIIIRINSFHCCIDNDMALL